MSSSRGAREFTDLTWPVDQAPSKGPLGAQTIALVPSALYLMGGTQGVEASGGWYRSYPSPPPPPLELELLELELKRHARGVRSWRG
jgi:hypothetical protein